jgi:hypothetical protein
MPPPLSVMSLSTMFARGFHSTRASAFKVCIHATPLKL